MKLAECNQVKNQSVTPVRKMKVQEKFDTPTQSQKLQNGGMFTTPVRDPQSQPNCFTTPSGFATPSSSLGLQIHVF